MKRVLVTMVAVVTLVVGLLLAAPAYAASWPQVQEGARGPNVTTIQHLLIQHGQPTEPDGIFGPDTDAKVTAFQTASGLDADGIVGPQTWPVLAVEVGAGSAYAEAVKAAQVQLVKHEHDVEVSGVFDEATEAAVRSVREAYGLAVTGVVDVTTWQPLVGTSGFSGDYSLPHDRELLPREEYDDPHHDYPAIDLPAPSGSSVYAVNGGTASRIAIGGSCGWGVRIDGRDGGEYVYCHFRQEALVSGAVEAGDLIGYSGTTGNSTGPHLYLQIRYNGALVCPQNLLVAIYDEAAVPSPADLPMDGCSYVSADGPRSAPM